MTDTKDYIIDRAFSLFMNRSYEAVSISDISQAIGLTKGALYHHFTNKEELFKAVVDKHLNASDVEIKDIPDTFLEFCQISIEKIKQTILKITSQTENFSIINYMSFITDSFRHYPGYAENSITFMNTETDKIKNILDRAITQGEIRSDLNTKLFSQTFFSYIIYLAGPIMNQHPIDDVIELLKAQIMESYKLIKI
jgi:TetR/AcrR family transcriptional regulator, transcriptional repressor for nem operon